MPHERVIPATTTVPSRVFSVEERGRAARPRGHRDQAEGRSLCLGHGLVQGETPGVHADGGSGRAIPPAARVSVPRLPKPIRWATTSGLFHNGLSAALGTDHDRSSTLATPLDVRLTWAG